DTRPPTPLFRDARHLTRRTRRRLCLTRDAASIARHRQCTATEPASRLGVELGQLTPVRSLTIKTTRWARGALRFGTATAAIESDLAVFVGATLGQTRRLRRLIASPRDERRLGARGFYRGR